jgi:peptidoglycan-associated lipoprotein
MTHALRLPLALLALAALAACSSNRAKDAEVAATVAPAASTTEAGAVATPLDADGMVKLPPELVDRRVIFFPYDSDTLGAAELELVAAHARFMSGQPGVRLRLEGHTDERGTREYNIGLGERRAQAVRRAFGLQGIADARLATVSYGEEQPAVTGSDDAALARNRRVELVYSAP